LDVLDGVGEPLVDIFVLPDGVDVDRDEVEVGGEFLALGCPPVVVVGNGDGLGDGGFGSKDILDDGFDGDHVVIPRDEGFVSDRDGDDGVWVCICELDRAADLGGVDSFVACEGITSEWFWVPGAVGVVDFGVEPGAEEDLDGEVVLLDEFQDRLGVWACVVEADETEGGLVDEDLEVLEDLVIGWVYGAVASVGVLSGAES